MVRKERAIRKDLKYYLVMKARSERLSVHYKLLWISAGIFAVSGILPWFMVQFPIGNLKISVLDIASYFFDPQRMSIDFYSSFIYGSLLVGWIFALLFLVVSIATRKRSLLLASSVITTVPPLIWSIIVPHLRVQMIFLSLSNQPINAQQITGSGEIVAIIAGVIVTYSFLKLKVF